MMNMIQKILNPDADHDHDGKPQLGEVARLDTCVTENLVKVKKIQLPQ